MSGTTDSAGRSDTTYTPAAPDSTAPGGIAPDSIAPDSTASGGIALDSIAVGGTGSGSRRGRGCGGRPGPGHRQRGFRSGVLTKLQAARLWIIQHRPYYARALLACPLIPTEARPTMTIAMDHQWRIFINQDHVETLTVEKTAATLIHEINHALRCHGERSRRTAPDELLIFWQAACELEINDDLEEDGFDVDSWLLPETFGLECSQTAETYYHQLLDQATKLGEEEVPDCGPVCGAHPPPAGPHHVSDGVDGVDGVGNLQQWMLRQAIAEAIVADAHGDDLWEVPPGLRAWAHETAGSQVNWRQVLARALRQSLHTAAGTADFTWSRPPRRHDPHSDVIRPGLAAPSADITVVLDTSGSMSAAEHAQAFSEIDAIIKKAVPGEAVRVLSVDHEVHTDQRIVQARQVVPEVGRGTDMCAGIETAAQSSPAAIVVITDGWTPWPRDPLPGARCVIAALTDNRNMHEVPGWIQPIDISDGLGPDHHDYRR